MFFFPTFLLYPADAFSLTSFHNASKMTQQFSASFVLVVATFTVVLAVSTADGFSRLRFRDDPPKCDRCVDAVTKVRDTLTNPNTTAKVKQVLELVCQFKPDQQSRQKCRSDLDAEVDTVVKNITATLANPVSFCRQYNLCEDQICSSCIEGVNNISAQIFGPDGVEAKIKTEAENYLCAGLPDFLHDFCVGQVDTAVTTIFAQLRQRFNVSLF